MIEIIKHFGRHVFFWLYKYRQPSLGLEISHEIEKPPLNVIGKLKKNESAYPKSKLNVYPRYYTEEDGYEKGNIA